MLFLEEVDEDARGRTATPSLDEDRPIWRPARGVARVHGRRPHYGPVERMRILKLKAARSWSAVQTSERFFVTMVTISTWLERVDEVGERALVQLKEPVNRFPDHVRDLVRWLKSVCPTLGKVRIAQALARAGLSLGATTVGRMLADGGPIREPEDEALGVWEQIDAPARVVTAKCPDHVWHVDMTVVPTGSGFWVPWTPFTLPQSWPFAWWLAVAVDHFSRRLQGFALFVSQPSAEEVCAFLERAIDRVGAKPKHIITDQGGQFISDEFKEWCKGRGVRPRKGAVGQQGSIAIVERAIRSIKGECTRQIRVPLGQETMREEIALYAAWYNEHRPHQALGGMTPAERYGGGQSQDRGDPVEPRPRWPVEDEATRVDRVWPVVKLLEGRKHLPIIELRRVA